MNMLLVKRTLAGAKIAIHPAPHLGISSFFEVNQRNSEFFDHVLLSTSGEVWLEENYEDLLDAQLSCEAWNKKVPNRL